MLKRNWALIAFVYLALAEALSLAPVPDLSLCLIQPEHGQQAANHDNPKYCPAFHVAAALAIEKTDVFLEHHDKSVVGGFTIVLALSTIGLWLATNKLWAAGEDQRKSSERIAERQRRSAERIATWQRMSDRSANQAAHAGVAIAMKSAALAERALTELERPWVFVFDVSRPKNEVADDFFIEYTVANYGKMPAIIERPYIGFVFSDADGLPQAATYPNEDHSLVAAPIMKAGEERRIREYFPVNPQTPVAFQVINEGTNEQALVAVPSVDLSPNQNLWFRAEISYRGPSSKGHKTGANWLYRHPWDLVIRGDEYNYTK